MCHDRMADCRPIAGGVERYYNGGHRILDDGLYVTLAAAVAEGAMAVED